MNKKPYNLEEVKNESARVLAKNPNHCILYVDSLKSSKNLKITNHKFIVPTEHSFHAFTSIIRKKIPTLEPAQALFYFIGDTKVMPCMTQTVGELYSSYKNVDGRMYIWYDTENVFG